MLKQPEILVAVLTRFGNLNIDVLQCVTNAVRYNGNARTQIYKESCSVAAARNTAVYDLLRGPMTHLLFVDSDTLLQMDAITLLHEQNKPIITGCTPSVSRFGGLYVPFVNVGRPGLKDGLDCWYKTWPPAGVHKTLICGSSCILIHRDVFETMRHPWYRWPRDTEPLSLHGEDGDFCERAREKHGYDIWYHGDVRCGHRKESDIGCWIAEHGEQPRDVVWNGPLSLSQRAHVESTKVKWEEAVSIDPYSSHLPVLYAVGKYFDVRRVVEFGCGQYSTTAFLNTKKYPNLEQLVSYETDSQWAQDTRLLLPDERLTIVECDLVDLLDKDMAGAGVILIDNGPNEPKYRSDPPSYRVRAELLHRAAQTDAIVILHDINNDHNLYVDFLKADYKYKIEYRHGLGPHTGVCSNSKDLSVFEGDEWFTPLTTTSQAKGANTPLATPSIS